jgi:hypothetical protein
MIWVLKLVYKLRTNLSYFLVQKRNIWDIRFGTQKERWKSTQRKKYSLVCKNGEANTRNRGHKSEGTFSETENEKLSTIKA